MEEPLYKIGQEVTVNMFGEILCIEKNKDSKGKTIFLYRVVFNFFDGGPPEIVFVREGSIQAPFEPLPKEE